MFVALASELVKNQQSRRLTLPRWSSSGHDKGMHDNEFTGRLDFNQYTREINASDVLHASPKPRQV